MQIIIIREMLFDRIKKIGACIEQSYMFYLLLQCSEDGMVKLSVKVLPGWVIELGFK